MLEGFLYGQSLVSVGEEPSDKILDKFALLTPSFPLKLKPPITNIINRGKYFFSLKRSIPSNHFVKSDASCPNIYSLIIAHSQQHLRCPIEQCTSHAQKIGFGISNNNPSTNSKVYKFNFTTFIIIQNITGFNVPMTQILRVDILQCFKNLSHDVFQLFLRQIGILAEGFHGLVFHYEVGRMLLHVQIQASILYHIWVRKLFDAVKISLQEEDLFFFHSHRFYCIFLFRLLVVAGSNNSIRPLTNFVSHLILLQKLVHVFSQLLINFQILAQSRYEFRMSFVQFAEFHFFFSKLEIF